MQRQCQVCRAGPGRLRALSLESDFRPGQLVAGGRKELDGKQPLLERSPGRVRAGSIQFSLNGETLQITGVPPNVHSQPRWRGEMDLFQRIGPPAQACRGMFPGMMKPFPFADCGSVGNDAGEPDVSSGELRPEMVEFPEVSREETQFGLNVGERQFTRRCVGRADGPA